MFALGFSLFTLFSCNKDDDQVMSPVGQEVTAVISSVIDVPSALSNQEVFVPSGYVLRYVMEVHDNTSESFYKRLEQTKSVFTIQLVSGHVYSYTIWTDYITTANAQSLPEVDFEGSISTESRVTETYYNTSNGLEAISVIGNTYLGNNAARDAFYARATSTGLVGTFYVVSSTLARPFGQIRVKTNDLASVSGAAYPDGVQIGYTKSSSYTNFDASTGEPSNPFILAFSSIVPTFTAMNIPYGPTGEMAADGWMSYDYVFASLEVNSFINFNIAFYNGSTNLSLRSIDEVPVKQNYKTIVSGDLLSPTGAITVVMDPVKNK